MHNAALSLRATVRQWLLYEHFIVLVAYNQHEQINRTQLFKSMLTIRLFENKIDLLEARTVAWRQCNLPRKGKRLWRDGFGKPRETAFIYDCGLTQESLTQQRQSINQLKSTADVEKRVPRVDRDPSFTPLSIRSLYTSFPFRQHSPLNNSWKNEEEEEKKQILCALTKEGGEKKKLLKFPICIQLNTDPKVATLL